MSTYYEFVGSLSFATPADAAKALAKLRGDGTEDTVFWLPKGAQKKAKDLVLEGRSITFASKGWAGAEPFYSARALVGEIVQNAVAGHVRVQEGDGGPGTQVDRYGFKPKKAAATKKAAVTKKAPVKKKRAATKAAPPKAKKKQAARKKR
ncbi:MAG: hypothetical protein KF819_21805 [Labilithrix sp.]|nr:hypothetical protein [Labilithrix sp.]